MQHRPGMFADWTEMFTTVTYWAMLSFFVLWLLAIAVALVWSLT